MGRLDGKVIAVTGATKGIGSDIAAAIAAEGGDVVLGGRTIPDGEAIAARINCQGGGRAVFVPCDVAREEDCRLLIERTVESFGRIDGLVNNAGIFPPVPFFESDGELFDRVYAVNAKGAFLCAKYAAIAMGEGGGSLVHIGSTHAFGASPHYAVYGTSKGALYSLSAYLSSNLAGKGIRSNCVTVGWVVTQGELERVGRDGHDLEWLEQAAAEHIPLGRLQTGMDIAYGVIYLLSDESTQVTGSDIKITGGFTPSYR